jgi:ketosteroid isomerase-like protein
MEGFRRSDHQMVLSCLTDDVVWDIPGFVHLVGKLAFDAEIENPAFVGSPKIDVTRMIEENNTVVAEGRVQAQKAGGGELNLVFCDVFEMQGGKIRRLISYLTEIK